MPSARTTASKAASSPRIEPRAILGLLGRIEITLSRVKLMIQERPDGQS
jgi:hypothetical protein